MAKFSAETPPTLDEILATSWDELEAGAARARHPYHLGTLATGGGDGPDARTVVLRAVDREPRRLVCHTDARSGKVEQIALESRVAWCFYDPETKVQIRLWGRAAVHTGDAFARERWEGSALHALRCYGVDPGPGSPLSEAGSGLPEGLGTGNPTPEQAEAWFGRFATIVTSVDRLDWLYLRARGHLRARFDWAGDRWDSRWLVP